MQENGVSFIRSWKELRGESGYSHNVCWVEGAAEEETVAVREGGYNRGDRPLVALREVLGEVGEENVFVVDLRDVRNKH